MNAVSRCFVCLGCAFAFLGVALGAFGAHGLRDRLADADMAVYTTGVHYHLVHALGLILVGLAAAQSAAPQRWRAAGWLMAAGVVLFSGSLYALAVTGIRALGAITPIGGVAFLAAWAAAGAAAWRSR